MLKLLFGLLILLSGTVQAYTQLFDWATLGWTPNGTGSLPRTYTDVGGRGIDVVVDISPVIRFVSTTPQLDGANGLRNYLNFDSNTESTIFTFSFFETGTTIPAGVTIGDITTKDLDADTYQDAIIFLATPYGGGTMMPPDSIQLYAGTNVIIQNSSTVYATANTSVGVTDIEGWATAHFETQFIQSFTIEYHNGPSALANPNQQFMWISNFNFTQDPDFGDAPASYSDASHISSNTLYMGTVLTDGEPSTQGFDGIGDDSDGNNDEEGVIFTATGVINPQEVTATVSVINDTGADAYLCGWLDEGLTGTFDPSDAKTCVTVPDNNAIASDIDLVWTGLPQVLGTTYARFRLCSDLATCSGPSNTPVTTTATQTIVATDAFPDGSGTSCVTPVIKTFTIADSFTLSDVNLTLNIAHTYRDDFNISLASPAGTIINLTTRGTIGSGANNLRVIFDDEAGTNYIDDGANHATQPPDRPRVPVDLLSAFDGENSAGTWTLNMCDSWAGDTGSLESTTLSLFGPTTGGPSLSGEVEDHRIDFDFRPTAVTIGKVVLEPKAVTEFLTELGTASMNNDQLLDLLKAWSPSSIAGLTGADRNALLTALNHYLDPDGDAQVAVLFWDTLEERGTIGFNVERKQTQTAWKRINNEMLPGLITAPMGGEYQLADPSALPGQQYQYQLIEQEARGSTRIYGPYELEIMP